jgi:hypothetical protein
MQLGRDIGGLRKELKREEKKETDSYSKHSILCVVEKERIHEQTQ